MYFCIILICLSGALCFQRYIANYCKMPKEKNKLEINIALASLTSVLCSLTYWKIGFTIEFVLISIIILCATVLSIVDIICFEIPQIINYILLVVSVIIVVLNKENTMSYIAGVSITGGIFLLLYVGTKGEGLGFGDVKLMFCAGLGLGLEKALLTFLVCFVTGGIFHPILMKFFGKGTKLAFGPYIALGIVLSHLYGEEIIKGYMKLIVLEGF